MISSLRNKLADSCSFVFSFSTGDKRAASSTAIHLRPHSPARLVHRLLILSLMASCGSIFATKLAGQTTSSAASSEAPASAAPAVASPMAGQAMLYPGEDFQLGPGDLISVHVFLQPDYQSTVRVDADGNVKLPFIGSANLKGQTVREAQALIAGRLQSGGFYTNPEVIIQVLDTVNGSVLVTGEMHQIVPVSTERSLKDVLLTAGGLPATASHTVKIVRAGLPDPIVVDLGTDLATSRTANIAVRPHDIIQISRASVVYVLGAFTRQGAVPLDQSSPLTLLQVAALSGGIGFEGKFDDLRLIRTVGTDRKVIEVDIKKIRSGEARDPILQANDIVFLPTNAMKAILKNVGAGGVIGVVSLALAARAY
jgi:polysaccharide export outer membrane protein